MLKKMAAVLFFLSTTAFAQEPAKTPKWELLSERNGIKISRHEVEGSPILAVKGEAVFDLPIAKVATVLIDTSRMTEWAPDMVEMRDVRTVSDRERIEYVHQSTPWPLKDRDFVFSAHVGLDIENKTLTFTMKPVTDELAPVKKDKVRAEMNATYILKSVAPGKTAVSVELHADPKGSIPKWIVNLFQKSWPTVTLEGMRDQAAKADVLENAEVTAAFGPSK